MILAKKQNMLCSTNVKFAQNTVSAIFIMTSLISMDCIAITSSNCNSTRIRRKVYGEYPTVEYVPDLPEKVVKKLLTEFKNGRYNEDIHLNITQLIQKYGYDVETHNVETADGYVLTMFRIPRKGPPFFLMHGLLSSADEYITSGTETSLGYLLAAAGYDVWLGNARGNKHSRRHARYSPDTDLEKFWNFSWDEIGRFDLPAMIDYVLNVTQRQELAYAGHSQGTTSFFVMTSMRPEYNKKIAIMVALSPVAWMSHLYSPIFRWTISYYNTLYAFALNKLRIYEIFPNVDWIQRIKSSGCTSGPLSDLYCQNLLFLLCGFNYAQINASNLHVVLSHVPGGASIKQLMHYGQEIISGHFRRFDYGKDKNMKIYGSKYPPDYPVENITCPIALFYGDGDWLANVTDIEILKNKLRNIVDDYLVPCHRYNHLDFVIGKDAKDLIFSRVMYNLNGINYR